MNSGLKSQIGIPAVDFPGQRIDLVAEARRSRQRLYPATIVYSGYAVAVFGCALAASADPLVPFVWLAAGAVSWTLIEYLAHRYVLHGRFPDGSGLLTRWLHRRFDHLHVAHHQRPWDGNHINGTIGDTLVFMVGFGALSMLAPLPTLPVLWAGVMLCYVIEEWVHQSVHYLSVYGFKGAYWRYIARHHTYHHSPRGTELAYGLTNGAWDIVFGTRIPPQTRVVLYDRRAAPRKRPRCAAAGRRQQQPANREPAQPQA